MTPRRLQAADFFPAELKPYLKYSAGAHLLIAVLVWQFLNWKGSAPPNTVYSIDFVGGPASVITSAGPSGGALAPKQAAPPSKAQAETQFDEFGRRKGKHGHIALPRPSLLKGWQAPKEQETEETQGTESSGKTGAETPASAAKGGGGSGMPGAEASADMPNFPYPWYISQVREMLWQRWQERMPKQAGECVVVFSLMPNGSVVDLRTESSSGDSSFDLTAMAAVQDAAPYPPLPKGFTEPFLKVHVTLRSQ